MKEETSEQSCLTLEQLEELGAQLSLERFRIIDKENFLFELKEKYARFCISCANRPKEATKAINNKDIFFIPIYYLHYLY